MRQALLALLTACAAIAQLPPSTTLSGPDRQGFDAEVARLETLLESAPDQAAVTYQVARTMAFGQQWPEAIAWLKRAMAFQSGIDPARDSAFLTLRSTSEFQQIVDTARTATPAVSHSTAAFQIAEGDVVPESMAVDPHAQGFYFGSQTKGKIIRCSSHGACSDFATGLGVVLGLKISGPFLWLVSNSTDRSELLKYDTASGRRLASYAVQGRGHTFNDLTIAPSADVFVTDTTAGAIWSLRPGDTQLTRLPVAVPFANGIALSTHGNALYVSTFPDGITLVDLKTRTAAPIARPAGITLVSIDGLYATSRSLIAVQNGFMSPRVVRLRLDHTGRTIERMDVLECRNPLFDGVTTGAIARGHFFYMANIQDEKKAGFNPIVVLKIRL